MQIEAFSSAPEDPRAEVHRLECGHGFHTTCIIQSLRASGAACPICRSAPAAAAVENPFQQLGEFFVEEVSDEDEVLHSIRSNNPRVQAARSNLKLSISKYNVYRDGLRKKRREALSEAMKHFTRKNHAQFVVARERVQQSLDNVKKIEVEEYLRTGTVQDLEDAEWYKDHQETTAWHYLVEDPSVFGSTRRHDPMNRGFWKP
jgi:hypothetical protein